MSPTTFCVTGWEFTSVPDIISSAQGKTMLYEEVAINFFHLSSFKPILCVYDFLFPCNIAIRTATFLLLFVKLSNGQFKTCKMNERLQWSTNTRCLPKRAINLRSLNFLKVFKHTGSMIPWNIRQLWWTWETPDGALKLQCQRILTNTAGWVLFRIEVVLSLISPSKSGKSHCFWTVELSPGLFPWFWWY